MDGMMEGLGLASSRGEGDLNWADVCAQAWVGPGDGGRPETGCFSGIVSVEFQELEITSQCDAIRTGGEALPACVVGGASFEWVSRDRQ